MVKLCSVHQAEPMGSFLELQEFMSIPAVVPNTVKHMYVQYIYVLCYKKAKAKCATKC